MKKKSLLSKEIRKKLILFEINKVKKDNFLEIQVYSRQSKGRGRGDSTEM